MTTPIDIRTDHLRIVHDVLARHLPDGVRVWVFGSRATWATKDSSDLDLALEGETEIPQRSLSALEAAFEESDLPYSVDIVDVRRIGERFKQLVETRRLPLPMVTREGPSDPPPGRDVVGMPSGESASHPSGWQDTTLRDLIEIRHGFAFGGRFIHDEPDGPVLLTPGNFAIGGGFKGEKFKYYSGPVPSDFVLSKGDLIVTMTDLSRAADTLGYPAFVPAEVNGKRYLHNQRLGRIVLRSQEIGARFLFYVMCSPGYRHEVLASATGTTVKRTSPDRILGFRLRLPPLAEQRAIAHILGTLDDKIELNRRTNATLEAMARALFRSWFVDFDPVRAKMDGRDTGLPKEIADLFPDRLVDSDGGEAPAGWQIESLFDHFEATKGVSYKGSGLGGDGLPLHNLNSIHEGGGYKYEGIKFYSGEYAERHRVRPGDVIVANTEQGHDRLLIGYAAIVPELFGPDGIASHHIYRLRPRSASWLSTRFLLFLLNSARIHDVVSGYANGTTVNMLPIDGVQRPPFVVPPKALVEAFDFTAAYSEHRREQTVCESRTLTVVRDALLPQLVSGAMRVRDAEKLVGAIA